jgi:outer membrane protein TolC
MKTKSLLLFTIILTLITFTVNAQKIASLEQCRELALKNNKSNAIAVKNKEKSGYLKNAYFANYFPKISGSANYLYTNTHLDRTITGGYLPTFVPDPTTGQLKPNILMIDPNGNPVFKEYAYFPDMNLSLKLSDTWMAGLSAEQPIYTGGKITAAYKISQIGEEIADLNLQYTNTEVIVKTDEAYWTHVQMAELVKLAASYRNMLNELLRNVQDAHDVGLKHKNDVLKVQVKVNEAELQLLQAENALRLSKKNLCHIMGLEADTEISIPEFLGEINMDISYTNDFDSRPEYTMLNRQIKLKQQQIKLTQSDFLPKIGLLANYGYINGLKLNNSKMLDKTSLSVLASVSIPIFQWGEGKNKIRAAKTELDIAQLECENISEQMELEITRAIDKCNESALEVKLTDRSLEQAKENMNLSKAQYETGMETLSNYLEAQTMWQRSYMEHINALTRQYLNRTYYLKATGNMELKIENSKLMIKDANF